MVDLTKDGTVNTTMTCMRVSQFQNNPLVNNKGRINNGCLTPQKLKVGLDSESGILTKRLEKSLTLSASAYKKISKCKGLHAVGFPSAMHEVEEKKFSTPLVHATKVLAEWPKLVISPLETKSEETTTSSEVGNKYTNLRAAISSPENAKEVFSNPFYCADIATVLQPLPPYTKQAYKYRMEAFTSEVQKKHAKDLSLYQGTFHPYNFV